MIGCILLIWIGSVLNAPWWYYALLGVYAVGQILKYGISVGKGIRHGE